LEEVEAGGWRWSWAWVFPTIEVPSTPKWMVKIMGNPLFQTDDLGVPLFLETSIYWDTVPSRKKRADII